MSNQSVASVNFHNEKNLLVYLGLKIKKYFIKVLNLELFLPLVAVENPAKLYEEDLFFLITC